MPYKNNFWIQTVGRNTQVLLSKAVAYTAQATYAAFVTGAAEGEMGVFNADTYALISGGGAVGTTVNIFVAVKRDGAIERSVIFQVGSVDASRTAYTAPVKQVTDIDCGATRASLVLQTLTFVAKAVGTVGNAITVAYVVAGNNTPLSVSVAGSAITINCATNGAAASTSIGSDIVTAVQNSVAAMALLSSVYASGNASTVITAAAATNLAGGTNAAAPTVGNIYSLRILETTPGFQPFPTYAYSVTAVLGDTFDIIMNKLVTAINSTTSIANRDRDLIVTASYNPTGEDLTLTANNFGCTFRVQLTDTLASVGSVIYTTPANVGSGYPAQVQLFQKAGDIYKGVTTQYPLQGSQPADWGQPSDFVDTTQTYNIYAFTGNRTEKSKSPQKVWNHDHCLVVICPSSGTSPEVQLKAIFGL